MTSHTDVAHNWAHQTGRGQRGFNMFYEGTTIYSYGYHFPIASFAMTKERKPRQVVLFNSGSYSVSTSKHQTYTRSALPRGIKVFNVPHVNDNRHLDNFKDIAARMRQALAKSVRARKYKDMYLNSANRLMDDANEYRLAFGLARQVKPLTMPDNIAAHIKAHSAALKRAKQAEERKRIAAQSEARDKWLAGEGAWHGTVEGGAVLVRLVERRPDRDCNYGFKYIETSLGIRVPCDEAVKVFKVMQLCKKRGKTWQRNGQTLKADQWQVDRIAANGDLRAGCHFIPWKYAEPVAKQLGL